MSGVAPLLLALAGLVVLEGPADRPELDPAAVVPPGRELAHWPAWPTLALTLWLLVPPLRQSIDAAEDPVPWTGLAVPPLVLVWAAVTAVALALEHRFD